MRADLIERRLWPVLVILAGGFAAAVVLLGGGGSSTPTPGATPPVIAGVGTSGPALSAVPPDTNAAIAETANGTAFQRQGGAHDPFSALVAATGTTGTTGAAGTTSSGASSSGSGSGSSGSGSGGTSVPTPSVPTPPTPTPSAPISKPTTPTAPATINADFDLGLVPVSGGPGTGTTGATGPTGSSGSTTTVPLSDLQSYSDQQTGAVLPDASNEILQLLGVGSDGTSLRFALEQELIISGPATCEPSATNCQDIDLEPGDIETLQYESPTLGLVQYELAVVSVNGHIAASAASLRHAPRASAEQAAPIPLSAAQFANFTLHRGTLAPAPFAGAPR